MERGGIKMKKHWLAAIGMSTLFVLGACGNDSEDVTPPVQEGMELEAEQTGEEVDPNAPTKTFKVKDGEYATFLESYEKELHDNGWETTLDGKPDFLTVQKGDRELKVMPVELDGEVVVHMYEETIELEK